MTPDTLTLELRAMRAELAEVRDLVAALRPQALTPGQRAVVEGLAAVFGTAPFMTAEAVAACAFEVGNRPALRAALLALVGSLTAQRVGIALGRIVELGGEAGETRLTAPRNERGRRLWCCDRRAEWG